MKENKDYIIKRLANTLKLAKQELEGDLEQFLNIYLAMEKTQDKEALNKFIETLTSKKKKGIAPKRKRGAQPGNQNARKYRPIPRRKPRQKEEEIDSLFCETSNKVESKENKQVSENTKNANEGKSLVLFEVKQTENKQVSEEYTEFEEISENFKEKEKERKKKNQKERIEKEKEIYKEKEKNKFFSKKKDGNFENFQFLKSPFFQKLTQNLKTEMKEKEKSCGKKEKERFSKPSVEQVAEYCSERNNGINPELFCDFYESKGWYVGKNKMKDWKACVRTWEQNEKRRAQSNFKNFVEVKKEPTIYERVYDSLAEKGIVL